MNKLPVILQNDLYAYNKNSYITNKLQNKERIHAQICILHAVKGDWKPQQQCIKFGQRQTSRIFNIFLLI